MEKIKFEATKSIIPDLLFKFDYTNNFHIQEETESIRRVKDFTSMFSSLRELETFLNEVFYTITYDYSLLKAILNNGTMSGKYDDVETETNDHVILNVNFKQDDLMGVKNIDDFILFVKSTGNKGLFVNQLKRFKCFIDNTNNYNEKFNSLIEIVKCSGLYLISNKNKINIVETKTSMIERLLNDFIIDSSLYGKDKQDIEKIRNMFIATKRNMKPKGKNGGDVPINELSYINKGVVITDGLNRILIEESRKKLLALYNKMSINFISIISEKKFKQKGIQIFEMLDDEDKISLLKCVKK